MRLCFDQVARIEAVGEPGVDGLKKRAGLVALAPIRPQPRERRRGAQLDRLRADFPCELDSVAKVGFREFLLLEIPPYPRRSDLPSAEESLSSRPLAGPPGEAKPLDPRLAPLLGLANRLRSARDKE